MHWRNLFGGGQPPPQRALPDLRLTLQPVPVLQPLAINPNDPLDRLVADAWHRAQQRNPAPTWDEFLAGLAATNASLAVDIGKLSTALADYDPERNYRP